MSTHATRAEDPIRRNRKMTREQWDEFIALVDRDRTRTVEEHCVAAGVSRQRYYAVIAEREIKAMREAGP